VQRRDILTEELGSFDEVVACGTAVVVTPVERIKCKGTTHEYGDGTKVGDTTRGYCTTGSERCSSVRGRIDLVGSTSLTSGRCAREQLV